MHLVGFVIRIFHAARSPEPQIKQLSLLLNVQTGCGAHTVFFKISSGVLSWNLRDEGVK